MTEDPTNQNEMLGGACQDLGRKVLVLIETELGDPYDPKVAMGALAIVGGIIANASGNAPGYLLALSVVADFSARIAAAECDADEGKGAVRH